MLCKFNCCGFSEEFTFAHCISYSDAWYSVPGIRFSVHRILLLRILQIRKKKTSIVYALCAMLQTNNNRTHEILIALPLLLFTIGNDFIFTLQKWATKVQSFHLIKLSSLNRINDRLKLFIENWKLYTLWHQWQCSISQIYWLNEAWLANGLAQPWAMILIAHKTNQMDKRIIKWLIQLHDCSLFIIICFNEIL